MLNDNSQEFITKELSKPTNSISVGITWVDGRCLFKHEKKWSKIWFGICNFSNMVWAISPLDYLYPIMITTINISPLDGFCEKAYTCLHFECYLNKFNKNVFVAEFKDCGAFTLGLPLNIGSKPLWFNRGKESLIWKKFVISPQGGRLEYNEEKAKEKAKTRNDSVS